MSRSCDLSLNLKPLFGNKVSKSNRRTKRRFIPNLHPYSCQSVIGKVRLCVATATMRTIRKYGGFDTYIVGIKARRLTLLGRKLRKQVAKAMQKKAD